MKTFCLSRTDNIGDVILTFPMAGYLKTKYPNCKIIFVGKTYTKDLCQMNQNIDQFLNWSELETKSDIEIVQVLKDCSIDTFYHVYPNKRLAKLVKKAGIAKRVGTAHRAFHLFTCNHKKWFSRKKSSLHEAQLNFKLLDVEEIALEKLPSFYNLKVEKSSFAINTEKKNIIFHAKSFGSAIDWPIEKYIEVAKSLPPEEYDIYFTGTEKESPLISPYIEEIVKQDNIHDLTGKFNLKQFIEFIRSCDGLVACSTGPLHIASSVGINALGFYSLHRPIHPGRWKPVGEKAIYVGSDDLNDQMPNLDRIHPKMIIERILQFK